MYILIKKKYNLIFYIWPNLEHVLGQLVLPKGHHSAPAFQSQPPA